MSRWISAAALALSALLSASVRAAPTVLFDNGPVNNGNSFDNTADRGAIIYDDFSLASATSISELKYHIFTGTGIPYLGTNVWIYSGALGTTQPSSALLLTTFTLTGIASANGRVGVDPTARVGFDIDLAGLDIDLAAGTYTLGLSTLVGGVKGNLVVIGSGRGSAQTLGAGSVSATDGELRGQHVAFTVIGEKAAANGVPEPDSLALLGLAAAAAALASGRRRKFGAAR